MVPNWKMRRKQTQEIWQKFKKNDLMSWYISFLWVIGHFYETSGEMLGEIDSKNCTTHYIPNNSKFGVKIVTLSSFRYRNLKPVSYSVLRFRFNRTPNDVNEFYPKEGVLPCDESYLNNPLGYCCVDSEGRLQTTNRFAAPQESSFEIDISINYKNNISQMCSLNIHITKPMSDILALPVAKKIMRSERISVVSMSTDNRTTTIKKKIISNESKITRTERRKRSIENKRTSKEKKKRSTNSKTSIGTSTISQITVTQRQTIKVRNWTAIGAKAVSSTIPTSTSITATVQKTRIPTCPEEFATGTKTLNQFLWPITDVSTFARIRCSSYEDTFAKRPCLYYDVDNTAYWGLVDDFNCRMSQKQRATHLRNLAGSRITSSNASEITEKLLKVTTEDPISLNSSELTDMTTIMEGTTGLEAVAAKVFDNMVYIVDNFLGAESDAISSSQDKFNTSTRVLSVLGNIGQALSLESGGRYYKTLKRYSLATALETKKSFRGISLNHYNSNNTNISSNILVDNKVQVGKNKTTKQESNKTSIFIPADIMSSISSESGNDSQLSLVFLIYNDAKLFQSPNTSTINSKVISAEIRGHSLHDLSSPIVTTFTEINSSKEEQISCVWWDVNKAGGHGDWSNEGCYLYKKDAKVTTCHCNHLTNFAVIMGATPPDFGPHKYILTTLTYIGCSLSIGGALITLMTHLIFSRLRESNPPKILMNLCIGYILLYAAFLFAVTKTESRLKCQITAAVLHYLLLCIFCWCAIEGFYSFRALVMPYAPEIRNFIRKAMFIGWGVPIAFVAVGVSIWPQKYGDEHSCVVTDLAFYVTLLPPVILVVTANCIVLMSITFSLNENSLKYNTNPITHRDSVRIATVFAVLLGLTWSFGFLVVANDIIVFQYLFCSFSSLQGFYIFIFYFIKNDNVKRLWKAKVIDRQRKSSQSYMMSSSTSRKNSSSVFNVEKARSFFKVVKL